MMPYRSPYPVPGVIWASLPFPTLLIDRSALIIEANPAAETFLNTSQKALRGQPVLDRLSIDAPMEEALARARANQSPLNENPAMRHFRKWPILGTYVWPNGGNPALRTQAFCMPRCRWQRAACGQSQAIPIKPRRRNRWRAPCRPVGGTAWGLWRKAPWQGLTRTSRARFAFAN